MPNIKSIKNDHSGFTLIEMIITITIMGILMGIAALNFNTWQTKNKIESQVREIFVDLNEARTNAFTQKQYYSIIFQPNSYVMKSYSTSQPTTATVGTTGTVVVTKNLKYALSTRTNSGTTITSIVDTPVIFDTSGITFNWFTVTIDPSISNMGSASVNCLVISTARANMGKMNGTTCEFK